MKLSKRKLNQIIQEEYNRMLQEQLSPRSQQSSDFRRSWGEEQQRRGDIENINRQEAYASAVGGGDPEYGHAIVDKAQYGPGRFANPRHGADQGAHSGLDTDTIQGEFGRDYDHTEMRLGQYALPGHHRFQPSHPGHPEYQPPAPRVYKPDPPPSPDEQLYDALSDETSRPGFLNSLARDLGWKPKIKDTFRESLARQIERYIYESLKG